MTFISDTKKIKSAERKSGEHKDYAGVYLFEVNKLLIKDI